MAIQNNNLFLIPLVIGVIVAVTISNWETIIASLCFAAAISFFIKASESNSLMFWFWGALIFLTGFILAAGDALRRILSKNRLKERIILYVSEGEEIRANEAIGSYNTTDYIKWMQVWSAKVAKDIRSQKNQSEANLFLADGETQLQFSMINDDSTRDSQKRTYAAQIVGTRLLHLKDFRDRI